MRQSAGRSDAPACERATAMTFGTEGTRDLVAHTRTHRIGFERGQETTERLIAAIAHVEAARGLRAKSEVEQEIALRLIDQADALEHRAAQVEFRAVALVEGI
jgi:hypothetical protein